MPSERHQAMVEFLFLAFRAFVMASGGKVCFAPLRLRIRQGIFREPDLLLLKSSDDPCRQDRFWTGADLGVEVVSATKPERDLAAKKHDYAEGGVPEYWIVNPSTETITVLTLNGERYRTHGAYKRGQRAESVVLDGFTISVDESFDAD